MGNRGGGFLSSSFRDAFLKPQIVGAHAPNPGLLDHYLKNPVLHVDGTNSGLHAVGQRKGSLKTPMLALGYVRRSTSPPIKSRTLPAHDQLVLLYPDINVILGQPGDLDLTSSSWSSS